MDGAGSQETRRRRPGDKQQGGAHAPPQGRYIRALPSEHRRGLNAMSPVIAEDEFVHSCFLNVGRFKNQYSFDGCTWWHILLRKRGSPDRDLGGLTGLKLIGRLFRYLQILHTCEKVGVFRGIQRENIGRDD